MNEAKLEPRESDIQLMSFYQVDNLHDLIDQLEAHILKLQIKNANMMPRAFYTYPPRIG